ncbi:MAG: TIGR02444 family protein [Alphaproteobacteria bacterium]
MTDDGAADLWAFCLRVYAAPGVADACLRLQDEAGADIPLLLAALWSATEGPGALDAAALAAHDAHVAPWRDNVVRPLRRARRWMKGAGHAGHRLRDRVKADELAAERHQLAMIAAWLGGAGVDASAGADAPLEALARWLGRDGSRADPADLALVAAAAG